MGVGVWGFGGLVGWGLGLGLGVGVGGYWQKVFRIFNVVLQRPKLSEKVRFSSTEQFFTLSSS